MREFRFAIFTASECAGELRKNGVRVKLQERPFQLLLALLENPGEVVSREELRRRFWPDGTFVDFDHSISSTVNKLRSALNDSATHPRYIETVGRRGYRFLADVKVVTPPAPPGGETAGPPGSAVGQTDSKRRSLNRFAWLAVGLVVCGAAALAIWFWANGRRPAAEHKHKLAILPLQNLTGDPGEDYFSQGLTEEIVTRFGHLDPDHLAIVSLPGFTSYAVRNRELEKLTKEFGIEYFLLGSVRRDANQVRISLRLVQASDNTQIWARQYDRELTHLLTLQAEIAQEVAREISVPLKGRPGPSSAKLTTSLSPNQYEAYDLYLKGRYYWNQRTPEGFKKAEATFLQAITKDANLARAYAGLADTYLLMSTYYLGPPRVLIPKARDAASKALSIDDNLAEAHTSLAGLIEFFDWDWKAAEAEYRRAIQSDPSYPTAHQWYAEFLAFQGHFKDAYVASERARQLDPLSPIIAADHCAISYFSRQFGRAIEECKAVLRDHPYFSRAQAILIMAYTQNRQFNEALASVEEWRKTQPDAPWVLSLQAYVNGRSGNAAEAKAAFQKMQEANQHWKMDPVYMLAAYIGVGDHEGAIKTLQVALTERSTVMTIIKADPMFEPLRDDPRFQKILQQVNLAD